MPSLRNGDYRLIGAIQGSKPEQWYRQLLHAHQPYRDDGALNLSCDCAAWVNNQAGNRTCKHCAVTARLLAGQVFTNAQPIAAEQRIPLQNVRAMQPLLQGLDGAWRIEECQTLVARATYRFSLLEFTTLLGRRASAFVALGLRHQPIAQDAAAALAAWGGWAIAAEVARQHGYGDIGQPPDTHYRFRPGRTLGNGDQHFGVYDLLDLANQTDLGDGLRPSERAEQTLALFLGPRYTQLRTQGFLDVSSRTVPGRVYRLRLDPARRADRRVRVFDRGRYVQDYCIVRRDRMVPVQDAFLTIFMGLLANEDSVLGVVASYNRFPPYSDSPEREALPAVWQAAA